MEGTELDPKYESANAVVIYTLSPGATSYFKDLKVCLDTCYGGDKLKFVLSSAQKLLSNAFILTAAVGITTAFI